MSGETRVTHQITTRWKRPKGELGVTQIGSRAMTPIQALDWILSVIPEGQREIEHLTDGVRVTVKMSAFDGVLPPKDDAS